MINFTYHNQCKIIFGKDAAVQAGTECSVYGKKVLLVYGGGSVKKSGLLDTVKESLKRAGLTVIELGAIQPNPRLSSVYEGVTLCKKENIDMVLALGGGSVIDAAKAIAAGAKYGGDVWDFYERKAEAVEVLPVGTILTIAATGSESNKNSVITNWDTKQKRGYGSPLFIPKFALLDPANTVSVPLDQTVNGIVDIMAHVFEQYFSPTPDTYLLDRLAEANLTTVIRTAPLLIKDPTNINLRAEILWCSTLALNGSLSCGKTGDFASHMIEHEISAIYDIPHGAGLAIVFPNWMNYVYTANIEKFVNFAVNVWNVSPAGKSSESIALEGIAKTREFFTSIGAPSALSHYKIGAENIEAMSASCVKYGNVGGFRPLDKDVVAKILTSCL